MSAIEKSDREFALDPIEHGVPPPRLVDWFRSVACQGSTYVPPVQIFPSFALDDPLFVQLLPPAPIKFGLSPLTLWSLKFTRSVLAGDTVGIWSPFGGISLMLSHHKAVSDLSAQYGFELAMIYDKALRQTLHEASLSADERTIDRMRELTLARHPSADREAFVRPGPAHW